MTETGKQDTKHMQLQIETMSAENVSLKQELQVLLWPVPLINNSSHHCSEN